MTFIRVILPFACFGLVASLQQKQPQQQTEFNETTSALWRRKNFEEVTATALWERNNLEKLEDHFGSHHIASAKNLPDEWLANCSKTLNYVKQLGVPKISTDSPKNAVFIELGDLTEPMLEAFEFLVRNAMIRLGSDWMHTLVAGNRGCTMMQKLKSRISVDLTVLCYPAEFSSVDEYNNVFKSEPFWRQFSGEHLLMYQGDTIILRGGAEEFLQYDYAGAPWPRRNHDNSHCVGNGGFTIRSLSKTLEVIEKVNPDTVPLSENTKLYMQHAKLSSVPEDIYFSTAMIENGLGNVPTFEAARHFAEESVLGDDPLGAHQIWIDRPWKAPMDFSKIVTKLKYSAPCQRGRYYQRVPHRGGWRRVVEYLMESRVVQNCSETSDLDAGIPAFVDMIEFTPFKWNSDMAAQVLERPWIGVSHLTPDNGWKMMENWTFDHLIEGEDYFKDAFKNCQGIIFLSQRMQDYWHSRLSANTWMSAFPTLRNTVALKHPVDIHEEVPSFDLKQLQQTPNKKIVLLGQQLRRVHTIYQLEVGPSYEKVWSPGCPEEGFARMLTFAKDSAAFENMDLSEEQMNSVKLSYLEDSSDYDKMLATSYIIIDCYDASANNAILEAMRSKTPIFTRNLPAHVEYLGEGYPLFFDSVEALSKMFSDEMALAMRVQTAHEYLKKLDMSDVSLEHFGEKVHDFLAESFSKSFEADLHEHEPPCLECEQVEGVNKKEDLPSASTSLSVASIA